MVFDIILLYMRRVNKKGIEVHLYILSTKFFVNFLCVCVCVEIYI